MMDIAFVSIVVLLFPSCYLIQTPKEYFYSLGDNIIMLCTLQRETNPIIWRFIFNMTSSVQYSTDKRVNPYLEGISERLSIEGNYDLRISTIQKNDEGTYICSSNIGGTLRQHFTILSIVRPPTDLLIQNVKDNKVSGTEGRILALNCTAVDGKPPPEVKLTVSGVGVSVIGNQSVQYINQQATRDFDRLTVTCSASHSGLSSVLTTIVTVYLDLKPLKPTFSETSISTEETIPLTVSCTSEGSRPPARFQWYIGSTNVTTFAKATISLIQSSDTYTVHSTLTYHVNRSYNEKVVFCKVTNIADLIGTQGKKQLDVKYAPDIIVTSPYYTQNDVIRTVTCSPNGNPVSYIYHGWQHKSKYGEIIREFVGNKTLKLPDVPVILRYQDSGEYVCTASNGIKDKDSKLEQTAYGLVTVKAQPVFTSDTIDKVKQFGEINKAVDIYVNVYSVPKFTSLVWNRYGTPITIQNSAKYQSSSSPTIVKDKIHGKEIQLDGYNVTLTIHDLKAGDFVNYSVTLKSGYQDVKFTIVLESAISTTSSAVIGPVVGVIVTLVIVCASFIVILLIKRSQGKDKKEKNDTFYVNTGFQNIQNEDEYEEVENKFDVDNPQSSKTYETLGTKDKISVYDDLENTKGVTSSKSSMGVYEALGVQEKPSIYAEMENQKEQEHLNKRDEGNNQFNKPNDHNDSMELNSNQDRTEKVYENDVF